MLLIEAPGARVEELFSPDVVVALHFPVVRVVQGVFFRATALRSRAMTRPKSCLGPAGIA